MDDTSEQYRWLSEEFDELHGHDFSSQSSRNSVSTFSSSATSSIFSNPARYSQALSVASSQTSYSSRSAHSACSRASAYSHNTNGSNSANASRLLIRPSPKEKKAANPYACSHCSEKFSKRADRKKHILDKCPYLGRGSLCSQCLHVGRNKHQVDKHQKTSGHRGQCSIVDAKDKHAFTCSNDGRTYRSLEEYINHFSSERCHLNRAGATRHHRSRLRTLVSKGRDDVNGHSYIYAAFVSYCLRKDLISGCNEVIDSLSEDAAQAYAERLEWGCMPDDGSIQIRLGYTRFDDMVREIMTWSDRTANDNSMGLPQAGIKSAQHSVDTLLQQPISPRRRIPQISQQSHPASKPLPNTPALQTQQVLQSAAVAEASAMLKEDLVLRQRSEQHKALDDTAHPPLRGYKAKRPRPLATSQQQESTIRAKSVNTQPSPIRNDRHAHAHALTVKQQSRDLPLELEEEEDLDTFIEWPEQYSLTPPLTARNLSSGTRAQLEIPSTRSSNEKRHAGIWEWSFDDFLLFEEHNS